MPYKPMHGDTDGFLVSDHTSRLSRLESSFQELIPIVSQTQTLTMSIHESLQEIRSDVKDLKQGHEDVSQNLIKFGQRIDVLDEWKKSKDEHRKTIKKTVYGAIGTVVAAFFVWLLGFK